ncbi:DUF2382 domain-containing protein (plasmid) [Deinococcus sp. KNUC1210]|uniref:YsnF/AvaK domain-containing protein n=1 Tax=Deinococcus sp. KNUC1210 TaxID=2917691 RepID=UPI001EF05BAA|nr:YsnF/AvaK domain-containing protein [Deinococcus sp. KNUC1210]ULH17191.1 DUF2382 domain-containing protein [Deinococcus sp. KNUC1210]
MSEPPSSDPIQPDPLLTDALQPDSAVIPTDLDRTALAAQEMTAPGTPVPLARLELREERAQIDIDRFVQQHLTFRREVRTRTETHTAELRSEVLVITLQEGEAAVRIGDHDLKPGETFELLLYNERLDIQKRPYLSEVVEIGKQIVNEKREIAVDLNYEVLTVEEDSGLVRTLIPPSDPAQNS